MNAIKYADNLLLVRSIQKELRQAIGPQRTAAQRVSFNNAHLLLRIQFKL